ncbi:MAG: hypothetical protein RLY71_776 [Pseudomonadota bacterium]|jgi:hypothetical protein
MKISSSPVNRNEYGALKEMPPELRSLAEELLSKAFAAKKLTAPYNDMERHRRHGYLGRCLNYDYYDAAESSVLVQQRETERTKYGSSPRKNYFIIRRCGRGVTVIEAPKSTVVKLAKISTEFGQVIQTITGKAKTPLKLANPSTQAKTK